MDKKQKLLGLLGSAVIFGLSGEVQAMPQGGEGKCGNMPQKEEKVKDKETKEEKMKKKQKEMTCGGQGACGGMMKKGEGKS